MARDGSGNYNLPAGNPVVTGTVISSTQFNSTMTDVATAMTQSISKDGQTTPTNNLPMGGNKHTGVADGNLANQYASIGQTQNGSLNKATSVANVVDAFTAALTPAIAAYTDGQVVTLIPSVTNTTTTVTLALNGLAAKPVNKEGGVACVAGDIILNVPIYLVYYATGGYFLLLNPQKITGTRFTSPLVLPAPSSGTTLTVNGVANGAQATFSDGTVSWSFGTTGSNKALITTNGAFALGLWTNTLERLLISSAGNVLVNAPSSGPSVTVSNLQSGSGSTIFQGPNTGVGWTIVWSDTTNSVSRGFIGIGTSTVAGAAVTDFAISPGVGGSVVIGNANGGAIATRFGPNGNVTLAAASSGITLISTGAANGFAGQFVGSSTSGQSRGLQINAGTTSADIAAQINNQANSLTYFNVRGDGVVSGNDGTNLFELGYKDVPLNSQSANYTAVLSDRGKAINATASITVTIPSAIFSPGHVLNVIVGSGATITIAQGSGMTLQWVGNGATTGNRTLTGAGMASILFLTSSVALISGAGLT